MNLLIRARALMLAAFLAVVLLVAAAPPASAQLIIPNSIPDTALQNGQGSAIFTIASGCTTVSALVGSGTQGSWATTATTCTPVITFNVPAAKNGWICIAQDVTSGHAVVFTQTATSTTGCTVTGTTTSGDTVQLKAFPY